MRRATMTEITATKAINTGTPLVPVDLGSNAMTHIPSPLPLPQEGPTTQQRSVVLNSIIAGSLAGMASCIMFHPFDVVRTKIQTGAFESFSKSFSATAVSTPKPTPIDMGPMATVSHTFRNGGIRALYTGLSLPLLAQAAYKATVLTTNRETKRRLAERKGITPGGTHGLTLPEHFACGASGGLVNALVFVAPVEYVRSQLIAQHSRKAASSSASATAPSASKPLPRDAYRLTGPVDVVRTTLRRHGILGLWRGAGVTALRDSLGCGAFFTTFELARTAIPRFTGAHPDSRPTTLDTMGAGAMAGLSYWCASMPLDSLKTLVQSGTAKSAWGAVTFLVEREGLVGAWKRLFRGWQVAFGRGMPSAAISMLTYSTVYDYISGEGELV